MNEDMKQAARVTIKSALVLALRKSLYMGAEQAAQEATDLMDASILTSTNPQHIDAMITRLQVEIDTMTEAAVGQLDKRVRDYVR